MTFPYHANLFRATAYRKSNQNGRPGAQEFFYTRGILQTWHRRIICRIIRSLSNTLRDVLFNNEQELQIYLINWFKPKDAAIYHSVIQELTVEVINKKEEYIIV